MISIDPTPFEDAGTKPRDRRNDSTTCGYCRQRVPRGHECEQKREAMKERPCLLATCQKVFKPNVYAQGYCSEAHKRTARSQRERAKYAAGERKVTQRRAAERQSIAPLERRLEAVGRVAEQYAPMMGEALYEATLRLMRAA